LVEHFTRRLTASYHRPVTLTEGALRRVQEYSWPGNVRQLYTVLENAVQLSSDIIEAGDLCLVDDACGEGQGPLDLNLEHLEAWAIRLALKRSKCNITKASQLLGIHRDTLLQKMRRYGIDKNEIT
jgi:DNA-binding NtrC family response regulator